MTSTAVKKSCKLIMQTECKRILESLFIGKKFESIRPNWLKSTITGSNLELDCYNHELRLALEYNGEQHYKFPNYWHKSDADGERKFRKTVAHDIFKREVCKKLNIRLITVPYTVPKSQLCKFIVENILRFKKVK